MFQFHILTVLPHLQTASSHREISDLLSVVLPISVHLELSLHVELFGQPNLEISFYAILKVLKLGGIHDKYHPLISHISIAPLKE